MKRGSFLGEKEEGWYLFMQEWCRALYRSGAAAGCLQSGSQPFCSQLEEGS